MKVSTTKLHTVDFDPEEIKTAVLGTARKTLGLTEDQITSSTVLIAAGTVKVEIVEAAAAVAEAPQAPSPPPAPPTHEPAPIAAVPGFPGR